MKQVFTKEQYESSLDALHEAFSETVFDRDHILRVGGLVHIVTIYELQNPEANSGYALHRIGERSL